MTGWRRHLALTIALLVLPLPARGGTPSPPNDGLCALQAGRCLRKPLVAVFGAFPAELAPFLERATVRETVVIGDRVLRVGTLGGVPVVLGLLGIGMLNAASTTRLVLDHFDVDALVVSGVAGSPHNIGDVTVPLTWRDDVGGTHTAEPAMVEIARTLTTENLGFERCTPYPLEPPGPEVCLAHDPALHVGGSGRSADPFGANPLRCTPGGGEVLGCDVTAVAAAVAPLDLAPHGAPAEPEAVDMETGAAAAVARERGVPFIAFRAVSDGAGDPLDLPGFPTQFFAYYRLAARNAAAAASTFVERFGRTRRVRAGKSRPTARTRASCDWERYASAACTRTGSGALRRMVDRACRMSGGSAGELWQRAASLVDRPANQRRLGSDCTEALGSVLDARAAR